MKKILFSLVWMIFMTSAVSAQLLYTENFDYQGSNGDSINSPAFGNVWKTHSGGGSLAKTWHFQTNSLSYTGYPGTGIGGAVNFQNNARTQDVNAYIGSKVAANTLYASFLLKIDSTGGKDTATDYFFHFSDSFGNSGVSTFRARIFVSDGSSASTFKIGVSKGTGAKLTATQITANAKAPVFTTTEYNVGQTYVVVIKYTFNTTSSRDDNISLFVLNGPVPSTEPTADVSIVDTAISDLKWVQSVVLRQGSVGRTAGQIDGIKVFQQWGDMLSGGSGTVTYNIVATAGSNGSISPSGVVSVASGNSQLFTITPNVGFVVNDVLVDNVSQGAILSYNFQNVTSAHIISATFKPSSTSSILFQENFVYNGVSGDSLTSSTVGGNVWKAHGGGGVGKTVNFDVNSLSFPNYAGSGLGGSVNFQNNARSQDVNAFIGSKITTGALYTSFLIRIDSSGGKDTATDYFYHFCDTFGTAGVSNFRGRIFASDGSTPNTFKFGISKGTGVKLTTAQTTAGAKVPSFTNTEFSIGQTYLLVMKYNFVAGSKNDELSLFVLPTTSQVPSTEPTPDIFYTDTGVSDLRSIQSVVIRQGGTGRTAGTIDGIKVYLNWSDIANATSNNFSINGKVVNALGKPVRNVVVTNNATTTSITDSATGSFKFSNLATGNYTIKMAKNNDVKKTNGVSTIDIALVQRHVLNTTKLNTPYKIIAADVNSDGKVNALDIVFMRRFILGTDTQFLGKKLWNFVDSSYVFANPTNPFPYKDSVSISGLSANQNNITFIGVKLGDVNLDWNSTLPKNKPLQAIQLGYELRNNQDEVVIPVTVSNFKSIVGMQFTLNLPANVSVKAIRNVINGLDYAIYNQSIGFIWNSTDGYGKSIQDNTTLFELVLSTENKKQQELIELSNDVASIEAYNDNLNLVPVQLKRVNTSSQITLSTINEVLSIYPNPAKAGNCMLQVQAKQASIATIIVTNLKGKQVAQQQVKLSQGINQLSLPVLSGLSKGTYIVSVNNNASQPTQSVKMIVE